MNNKIFYVYIHTDPITNQIVYIGKGCNGRAWDVTRCRREHKQHQEWMLSLCKLGYIPSDWTTIIYKGLTEKEALDKEHSLINLGCPLYNRQSGEKQHQSKLTNKQAIEIYDLTKTTKVSHKELAEKYGVSRPCISMISSVKQWKAVLIPHIKANYEKRG